MKSWLISSVLGVLLALPGRTVLAVNFGSWVQLPGNGETTDSPTAVSDSITLTVFVRGTDNRVWRQERRNGNWNSTWQVITDRISATSVLRVNGPIGVRRTSGSEPIMAYAVELGTGKIYWNDAPAINSGQWSELPGGGVASTGVSGNWAGIVIRGSDGLVYFSKGSTASNNTWEPASNFTVLGTPGAQDFNGFSRIFYATRASDGVILTRARNVNNNGWDGDWTAIPAGSSQLSPRGTSCPSGCSELVTVRGQAPWQDLIFKNERTGGGSWSGWTVVSGSGSTDKEVAAAYHVNDNRVHLFVKGIGSFDRKIFWNQSVP